MKIAVVEWFPRVCGVHAWALNISHGLMLNGHEVERLTFTKSGRPLSAWGGLGKHWTVHRLRDAVDVLNGFDLIVLSDVVCRAPAVWKEAHREGRLPEFVAVLRATRTPWTSMAHDACHKTELDPTAAALFELPTFTGVLLTTVQDDVAARFGTLAGGPDAIHWLQDPYLPYAGGITPVRVIPTANRTRSAILTARLASNKGQDFLFQNLPQLGFDIHLWGDNPYGFPSLAWSMWEKAIDKGWDLIVAPKLVGNHTHPNAVKFYTGEFAVRAEGNLFHYHGPFAEQSDIDWSPWLGLNLTNATMRGHLEYAQLDMIAAGCVVAAPTHAIRAPGRPLPRYYDNVIPLPYVSKKESEAGPVLDLIRGTLGLGRIGVHDSELVGIAEALQDELRTKHNPSRVAQHFIDGVECYRRPSNYVSVPAVPAKEEKVEIEDLVDDVPMVECTAVEDPPDYGDTSARVREPLDEKPLLVINTYGGSLLVGAAMADVPVAASYEDVGFGQEHAKANFPEIPMIAQSKDWPAQDLSNKVVIAHPPCAAFSIQAKGSVLKGNERRAARGEENADRHGLNSDHFKCTTAVINYSLGQGARALAIESVPGALEGARTAHDEAGRRYGYHVYRILQNAATFGVPQWRPRYWTIYIRKDIGDRFAVWHEPKCISVGQLIASHDPGPSEAQMDRYLDFQREVLAKAGYPAEELLSTPGMLMSTLQKKYNLSFDEVAGAPRKKDSPPSGLIIGSYDGTEYGERRGPQVGYRFVSKTARVLDPDDCAGVILGDTWFVYKNRNITPTEYRAIMGFPRGYKLDRTYRLYLSKGVVPGVAKWIIELMMANVKGEGIPSAAYWMKPGETADFKPSSDEWTILAGVPKKDGSMPTLEDQARLLVEGRYFRPRSVAIESHPELIPTPPAVRRLGPDRKVEIPPPATPKPAVSVPKSPSPGLPAPGSDPTAVCVYPPAPTAGKAGKKKRVEGRYQIIGRFDPAAVAGAFESTRALLPPLKEVLENDGAVATVVVQYEPPNAGGNRTDVDRIVMRAAKKLSAEWRRV